MGNFIVFKKGGDIDYDSISSLMLKMHFKEPKKMFCSGYNLWLFNNLSIKDDLNYYQEAENWIFAAGTFFYKNFTFTQSLSQFYKDFVINKYSFTDMYGHYAILLINDGVINILNDSLGVQRIFSSTENSLISTSFLATWFSHMGQLSINRNAFYEKISTGYISAPDTLINGIIDITYESFEEGNLRKQYYPMAHHFKKCNRNVNFQVNALEDYFKKVISLAEGKTISLGVSGGFDSRMVLALIKGYENKYLFTHNTREVHTKESFIARRLAEAIHTNISLKETEPAENLTMADSEKLLTDLVYYYDGRTANNSGAFSFTGSYEYNKYHLNAVSLGLNGKGGEVYRNYYNLPRGKFSFKDWFLLLECYPSFKLVFNNERQAQIIKNIKNKIVQRVSPEGEKWDRWLIQRYYSEIRQPDCEGSIVNAHNKITRYVAPLLDANLLLHAYKSFGKKGASDRFQAKLIQTLSEELAGIDSKYGYNFINKSFKRRFEEWIKRNIPIFYKRKRRLDDLLKSQKKNAPDIHAKAAVEVLCPIFPEINWRSAIIYYAQRNNIIYLAQLVKEGKKYNKLK